MDGFLYYVMPYVEGESLRDKLVREHQLSIEEALHTTIEVADALGYAHSHSIVHRDVKPENVLFQAGHALVSDFGIARAVTSAGGETLTDTGVAIGTPAYMSPEQAAGANEQVRLLDGLVHYRFGDNVELMGAWNSARNEVGPPRSHVQPDAGTPETPTEVVPNEVKAA